MTLIAVNAFQEPTFWERNEHVFIIAACLIGLAIIITGIFWLNGVLKDRKGYIAREKTLIWLLVTLERVNPTQKEEVESVISKISYQDLDNEGREEVSKVFKTFYLRIFRRFLKELTENPTKIEDLFEFNFSYLREHQEVIYFENIEIIWQTYMNDTLTTYPAMSEKLVSMRSFLSFERPLKYFCELVYKRCYTDFQDLMKNDEIKLGFDSLSAHNIQVYLEKVKEIVKRPLLTYDLRENLKNVAKPSVEIFLTRLSVIAEPGMYKRALETKDDILHKAVESFFIGPQDVF